MELVSYPHPALTKPCLFIEEDEFGWEIGNIGSEMEDIMYSHNGAGLAAPQVGINRRVFVVKEGLMDHKVICNPIWDSLPSATKYIDWEGCLSFPNIMLPITRYNKIMVSYQDWAGNIHTNRLEGFAARVFQHESDHLHGVLFTSYLPDSEDALRKMILNAG